MKDWIKLQRQLYGQALREVRKLLRPSKRLEQYGKAYERDFRNLKKSTNDHLIQDINASQFTLVGDFHTLRQSQRLFFRLLRDSRVKKPKVIALEVLQIKDESQVQRWLQSKSFDRIKELLNLETLWGSSWETYEEMFQFCAAHKIKVIGLSSGSRNLHQRDLDAVKKMKEYRSSVWALFGEHHLASEHMPKLLSNARPDSRICIIQQNHDKTGLQNLESQKSPKTVIFSKSMNQQLQFYCILHCPLWMKWQSFLEWQMQLSNEDFSPEGFDVQEQLNWSLSTLYDFLSDNRNPLPVPLTEALDFHVYGPEDPHFYRALSKLNPAVKANVLHQLSTGNVGIALRPNRVFLSELTFNSCAHAAGSLLYRLNSQVENHDKTFFQKVLTEGMSYFLSKLLNHSRRAPAFENSHQRHLALGFSLHYGRQGRWIKSLKTGQNKLSMLLGRNLSEPLFEAFLAGEFSKSRLIRLVGEPVLRDQEAFEKLIEIKSVGESFSKNLSTGAHL
jgi:uncharacterized iron-regulated protein